MAEMTQATINTILLALVVGLIGLLARIFWAGIKNFRLDIGHLASTVEVVKGDLVEVRIGVAKIDTWKDSKDKLDEAIKTGIDRRLDGLENRVK